MKKLLVLSVAAMGADLLKQHGVESLAGLPLRSLTPASPAVTCTAQATLRTGLTAADHAMGSNGVFLRETRQSLFWCQSAGLVHGPRIWEDFRAQGGRVGLYFFQQSLGEAADEIVSPAPIHTHGGGMIMATYQKPERILGVDNPVQLWRYWGPLASPNVGRGIAKALVNRIRRGDAPELLFVYLPSLDYELQRHGTHHPSIANSVQETVEQIEDVVKAAEAQGYERVIVGDYAITDVTQPPCFPNRILREAGFFATRVVKGMRYPDFWQSRAMVLCDHQTALVYCLDPSCREDVRALLGALPTVDEVKSGTSGADWELVAKPGTWFAYPWWNTPSEAPDYATHVDIHNKPGFDPCELFFGGLNPFHSSTDTSKIRGTHGRTDAPVALASSLPFPESLPDAQALAQALRTWLNTPTE